MIKELNRLTNGLKFRADRALFTATCRRILDTPPIPADNRRVVTLSLVSHRDIIPYLCAIKSFRTFVPFGRVKIIDDGSLEAADRETLNLHLDNPEIIPLADITLGQMPKQVCWQRLACALSCSDDDYVIQLDSDTLSLAEMPEVVEAVERNRSFTLNSNSITGKKIVSMAEVAEKVKGYVAQTSHVQAAAESRLDQLTDYEDLKYTRGNAGFAGYAISASNRDLVERVSVELETILGKEKWYEWGSDMIGSNVAIANSANPIVLPWPKYASFDPATVPYEQSAFLHFIGSHRYEGNVYLRKAREFITRAYS